jgi:hypothetical protein
MAVYKAEKTLQAIEEALVEDQGNEFRRLLRELMPTAEDAYRTDDSPYRSHLGASLIGKDCARDLWYTFHWATAKQFEGRILRLFNRGHLEEPRFLAMLKMIGCEVWFSDDKNKQYRISAHDGHFGGGLDTVVQGVPEAPTYPMLGEFKTHGDKSFSDLVKKGVRESKLQHYIQMQLYMGGYDLPASLYMAVNKNTDELYGEIIPFDEAVHEQYTDRAEAIIQAEKPPPRLSNNPTWFQCKFCDHHAVCHTNAPPDINCRTCQWSKPGPSGAWGCYHPKYKLGPKSLNKEDQLRGCKDYHLAQGL